MAREEEKSVKEKFEEGMGSLRGCLMDGDAQFRQVQRKVRRRALVMSVALQSVALTLLLLAPLFGKTERITVKDWVPMPPYGPVGHAPAKERNRDVDKGPIHKTGIDFTRPPQPISSFSKKQTTEVVSEDFPPIGHSNSDTVGCSWCGIPGGTEKGPTEPIVESKKGPRVVQITKIDPAMLKHRVEPVYPILAKQTHHSGKVELRAIIGIDGRIRSLDVVVSDPLLNQSAIDAVQQWVYQPTILNGKAVEVDTYITVIYSSQQ